MLSRTHVLIFCSDFVMYFKIACYNIGFFLNNYHLCIRESPLRKLGDKKQTIFLGENYFHVSLHPIRRSGRAGLMHRS